MDWIIEDKIARAGETESGLKVFWFAGLGYWVCPPGANVAKGGPGRWLIHTPLKEGGIRRSSAISTHPGKIKERLWNAVDVTEESHGLYRVRIMPSDLKLKIHYKAPYQGRRGYYYTRVIIALKPYLGEGVFKAHFHQACTRGDAKRRVELFIKDQYEMVERYLKADFSFKRFYAEMP